MLFSSFQLAAQLVVILCDRSLRLTPFGAVRKIAPGNFAKAYCFENGGTSFLPRGIPCFPDGNRLTVFDSLFGRISVAQSVDRWRRV
jgi:hypothetical protein